MTPRSRIAIQTFMGLSQRCKKLKTEIRRNILDSINLEVNKLLGIFLNPNSIWYWGWVPVYLSIGGWMVFMRSRHKRSSLSGFLSRLFPPSSYFCKSARLDYKWFLLMYVFGLIVSGTAFYIFAGILALKIMKNLNLVTVTKFSFLHQLGCSLIILLAMDFGYTVFHYLCHKIPFLWKLHKVHHSATVLTPITNERVHPVERLLEYTFVSAFIFLGFVCVIAIFGGLPSGAHIGGFSLEILFFAVLPHMNHLRHSHIWISFGPLNWFISSPCMHQIHHSSDPKHHDKNFARIFSCFDLMLGSIHVPQRYEDLKFGVMEGDKMESSSHSFLENLICPLLPNASFVQMMLHRRKNSSS